MRTEMLEDGCVLEMCCAYHVYDDKIVVDPTPEEKQSSRRSFGGKKAVEKKVEEVVVTKYKHLGVKRMPTFRMHDPFEDLPLFQSLAEDHCTKHNMKSVVPTHERFVISDKVVAVNSLLVTPLNTRDWLKVTTISTHALDKKQHTLSTHINTHPQSILTHPLNTF